MIDNIKYMLQRFKIIIDKNIIGADERYLYTLEENLLTRLM